jgi:hypothetical protein
MPFSPIVYPYYKYFAAEQARYPDEKSANFYKKHKQTCLKNRQKRQNKKHIKNKK